MLVAFLCCVEQTPCQGLLIGNLAKGQTYSPSVELAERSVLTNDPRLLLGVQTSFNVHTILEVCLC